MDKNTSSNRLINSTSPYLLQHAYNPVDWFPWGNEAFVKAQNEDKPIILSIGYSSCHWCHVMERESFENDDVAKVMNENFISIKVDREERPDVDQIYMDAVQAMGANGGWPLNVFLTSDLKPFYGGTYFPAQQWTQLLKRIASIYAQQKEEIEESSSEVVEALSTSEIKKYHLSISEDEFSFEILNKAFQKLASRFDNVYGGVDKAPKFPMPSIWLFLLNYAVQENNKIALDHLKLTLDKMAAGGLYDQAGGGFARYSTDKQWFAPHFEKMLYDNGQLLSVYSQTYNVTKDPFYKDVIYSTVDWLQREMQHPGGAFYSALDADSEGEEGKFYVFTIEEIERALRDDQVVLAKTYFNIKPNGNWEHGNNILHAEVSPEDFARVKDLKPDEIRTQLNDIRKALMKYRSERIRPGLDDKVLTSWNALLISGLADAYKATGDERFLKPALNATAFINDKMIKEGSLLRSFNKDEARINAFLEDYATFIQALIKLYEVTFDENHLQQAKDLADNVIKDFFDEEEGMFFYTSKDSESLIARKKEIFDNVIPSSNSIMAINLYLLSLYFDDKEYFNIAERMIRRVSRLIPDEPSYLSNWSILYQLMSTPTAEIIIVGDKVEEIHKEMNSHFIPNRIIAGSKIEGNLPILKNRKPVNGKTTIYVCYDKACKLPVHTVNEALKQLH